MLLRAARQQNREEWERAAWMVCLLLRPYQSRSDSPLTPKDLLDGPDPEQAWGAVDHLLEGTR